MSKDELAIIKMLLKTTKPGTRRKVTVTKGWNISFGRES